MFCRNCGREIDENYKVCPYCGTSVDPLQYNPNVQNVPSNDNASFGWGILSLFFPVVGFILWLVWRKQKPKTAKVCLVGCITGIVLNLLLIILQMILEINGVYTPSNDSSLPPITDF